MNWHLRHGFIVLGLLALIFGTEVFAKPTKLYEKPISLQIENLTKWKNSPEAVAIRQGIKAMLQPRPNYPRVAEPFEGAKLYAPLYGKPFLTLEAKPGDFGGFFALIVFRDHPKVFRLWLYEIDKNVFEIREMVPLRATLNKEVMDALSDKRISPFWLTALAN